MFKSRLFKRVGFNTIIKRNMSFTTNELKMIAGCGVVCGVSNFIALYFAVGTSSIICGKRT